MISRAPRGRAIQREPEYKYPRIKLQAVSKISARKNKYWQTVSLRFIGIFGYIHTHLIVKRNKIICEYNNARILRRIGILDLCLKKIGGKMIFKIPPWV